MTRSNPATNRQKTRPRNRATPKGVETQTHDTNSNMNHTINYEGDWALHGLMSDFGIHFAGSKYHRIGFEIDAAGIQKLADSYRERVLRTLKWAKEDKLTWYSLLLRFDETTFVIVHGDGRNYGEIISSDIERVNHLHDEVQKVLQGIEKAVKPAFYMLRHDCGDFTADPIENLSEAVTDEFLRLCYGEDILQWITGFGEKTLNRAGGITIFEGPPGTGKTSLITQMIRRLERTHVFYALPASQDSALSSPELVPFWQKQNVRHADRIKVIVMEDAERLLWKRDGENREAVSSLLNIADGLMGRMLRLHIICSVNAKMDDLDPAILRPGRLMNHRRFKTLTRKSAESIAAARNLAFRAKDKAGSYTLAEVLNPDSYEPPRNKPSIGFHAPLNN